MSNSIQQLLETAWGERRKGNYEEARRLVQQAQENCSEEDFPTLGRIYHLYMQFEADHENYTEAMSWSQKSLSCYERTDDQDLVAHATRHLADLQRQVGREEEAEQHYRKVIRIYQEEKNTQKVKLANALRGFGLLLEQRGKVEEAINSWKEARNIYDHNHLQAGVDEADHKLSILLRE